MTPILNLTLVIVPPSQHLTPRTSTVSSTSEMERPRIPSIYGILQFTVRSVGFFLASSGLGILIYVVKNLELKGGIYGSALACAIIALVVDLAEVVALSDKSYKIWRLHPGRATIMDVSAMATGATGAFVLVLFGLPCCKDLYGSQELVNDKSQWLRISSGIIAGIAALHGVLAMWDIVDCCRGRRVRRHLEELARVQIPDPNANIYRQVKRQELRQKRRGSRPGR